MKSGKTSRKQRRKAVRSEGSENRPPQREGRPSTEVGARSSKLKNCVKEARDHIRVLRDRVQELESTGEKQRQLIHSEKQRPRSWRKNCSLLMRIGQRARERPSLR